MVCWINWAKCGASLFYFSTAKEQSNCGVTNKPNKMSPRKDGSWFSQLSAGAAAGLTVGCMVFVAVIVAASIMVSRSSFLVNLTGALTAVKRQNKKSPLIIKRYLTLILFETLKSLILQNHIAIH